MEIRNVDARNENVLRNLMQGYEAEFSAITKKVPANDGLFALDTFVDKNHDGYLLLEEGLPIGFAIKGEKSGLHDISEFYIVPSKRASGIGSKFAAQIFQKYPGQWQVLQIDGADKAIDFWNKAIDAFKQGDFVQDTITDPYWGKVTRQRFNV
jgi:predicted acetyltransferase